MSLFNLMQKTQYGLSRMFKAYSFLYDEDIMFAKVKRYLFLMFVFSYFQSEGLHNSSR